MVGLANIEEACLIRVAQGNACEKWHLDITPYSETLNMTSSSSPSPVRKTAGFSTGTPGQVAIKGWASVSD